MEMERQCVIESARSLEKLLELLHTLFHNFRLGACAKSDLREFVFPFLNLEHVLFNRVGYNVFDG